MYEDPIDEVPSTNFDNDTLADMQPDGNLDDSLAPSEGSAAKSKSKSKNKPQMGARRTRRSDQSLDLQLDGVPDEEHVPELDDVPVLEQDQDESVQQDQPETELMPPPKKKRGRPARQSTGEQPNSKRVRQNPAKEKTQKPSATEKKRGKAVLTKKDANAKIVSANGTRSNVRERHATPFDEDDTQYTSRSGRLVYRPLAHWKNERVNLQPTENDDGTIVYQISDVVRMEDVTPQKRIHQRSEDGTVVRRRRKRKITTIFEDADSEDHEEAWEAAEGVLSGAVRVWDPEIEASIDEKQTMELALAGSSIEPRDNAEGSFRFAKTVTMPFFGSGIVELPPGGIKKTKNSRRMHLSFFVHFGKVTVEVAGTRFTISKGGVWQVPRGEFIAFPFLEVSRVVFVP